MVSHKNGFEGQTSGVAVTTSNSAASGNGFTTVTPGTGGSITYSNAHPGDGSMGIAYAQSGTNQCYTEDASFSSSSAARAFVFWYSGTVPTTASRIAEFRTAVGLVAAVQINAVGKLVVQDAAGAAISGMTAAAALSAGYYRVELEVFSDATAGTAAMRYYAGSQNTTPVQSLSATGVNTRGGNITSVRTGITTTTAFGSTFYADSYRTVDGTTTPLGPFPLYDPPTANAGTDQAGIEPWTTITLNGTGSTYASPDTGLTYAWTQTAGPAVTLSSSTAASPTFTAPPDLADQTLTFSLVVTSNTGLLASSADTVDVTVLAATEAWLDGTGTWKPMRVAAL